jgi:3-deoxy-manno-octulosonate cytidylyltransferase (CMP-KDO synthetase)
MKIVVLIPARFASSRYPGKPLVLLRGADGVAKSLVQRTWEAGMAVPGVAEVHVLTDDERIAAHARGFGARVVMTPDTCANGTERCAAAVMQGDVTGDLFINLQGDAPLTPPSFVSALIGCMSGGSMPPMATPVIRCDAGTLAMFRADRAAGRVGGTTAVFGHNRQALYFSKEVIPFAAPDADPVPVFHHVGLYAYRPDALRAYPGWRTGPLERLEGLEQLRFLENGLEIVCVEVAPGDRMFWEINNPVDVARVEAALAARR